MNILRQVKRQLTGQQTDALIYRVMQPEEYKASFDWLNTLMQRYTVDNLVNTDADSFKKRIDAFLELDDYAMEGYSDPGKQRDMSVRFQWGHNHDFGSFKLEGMMTDRHISLLAVYMDIFKALPRDLTGKRVLDIGCWTGGASLLLSAMGAEVLAIDEVKKYVDCVNYLKDAFGLEKLEARNLSLYDLMDDEFQDAFDYVLYAGVIYHVTDPVLSLRIIFNTLKDGGVCLMESHVTKSNEQILTYEGPERVTRGSTARKNRTGWNWFFPSPATLEQMMLDVGFDDTQVAVWHTKTRGYVVGTRHQHIDMTRAGLSRRNIR